MKTKIKNIFGNVSEYDLQVYELTLDLENSREVDALEQGWLINDRKWYNSRSVRIDVNLFDKKPKPLKGYKVTYVESIEDMSDVGTVFGIFTAKRNLDDIYTIEIDLDRVSWILVHNDEGDLVAFSKMTHYDGGLETQFTAWDYSEPRASISRHLVAYEVELAKKLGYSHLYIGSGYGSIGVYKSKFGGFEWWDNDTWSTDADKYVDACYRDDTIKTLQDLSGLINDTTKGAQL
jgi:hypothetical protein